MSENLEEQVKIKPARDKRGRLLPGNSGNLKGRPKGQTLKEYRRLKFANMTEKEKEEFLKDIPKELQWRMAEGNPKQDTEIGSNPELPFILKIVQKNGTTGENS